MDARHVALECTTDGIRIELHKATDCMLGCGPTQPPNVQGHKEHYCVVKMPVASTEVHATK